VICREQDAAVRVAVRIVVVAAVVGWLVLFLQGQVLAGEPEQELATLLTDVNVQSEGERVELAREALREERNERIVRVHENLVETGWRAWTGTSPRRLLSGARDVAKEMWGWRKRSHAEDKALDWLEVGGVEDLSDPDARALYGKLSARERAKKLEESLEDADWALSKGLTSLARVSIERSLEIDPTSERARELSERLMTSSSSPLRSGELFAAGPMEAWEVDVAAALLTEDYASVLDRAPSTPSGAYARAVAEFLSGKPDEAVTSLEPLRERDDAVGRLANEWAAHEELNIEAAFTHEKRAYRVRQMLGFLGGDQLSERGVELSPRGYRAWRESVTPLNVAVSMPARVYRGWKPDSEGLREAAVQYLAQLPQGPQAEEAIAWLRDIQTQNRDGAAAQFAGWDGDHFSLPPARTSYARLSGAPVMVTKRVIDSLYVSDVPAVRNALGLGDAVMLEARHPEEGDDGLEPQAARRFLTELAFAIEQGDLDPASRSKEATLEAIRRLESALAEGYVLVAEPGDVGPYELWGGLNRALVDGQDQTVGALSLQRGKDDVRVVREIGRTAVDCPSYAMCVDRPRWFRGALIGHIDADSKVQLGLSTSVKDAHLSIGLNDSGPAASIVLPVGRWLGIQRWLPVAAYVSLSADSVYVGPAFVR
jgi:hypothetical protein